MSRANRFLRTTFCLLAGGAVASFAASGQARQEYHDAIVAQTGACHDCRLCHKAAVGSALTLDLSAAKPFAVRWFGSGMPQPIPDGVDSDGDGYSDLTELVGDGMGGGFGDPNDAALGPAPAPVQFECPTAPTPEYGCARISRGAPTSGAPGVLLAMMGAAWLIWRRRSVARRRGE